jgi:Tfp pilus assembly protein PilF
MGLFGGRFGTTRYEADEQYRMALQQYQSHDMDKAIEHINEAIGLAPANSEYYATRALFLYQHGVPTDNDGDTRIQDDIDEALERNAYDVLGNYMQGLLLFEQEDYPGAREYFMRSWGADSERPETLYYMALVAHREKDNPQAEYWMQQAHALFEQQEQSDRAGDAKRWLKQLRELIEQYHSD